MTNAIVPNAPTAADVSKAISNAASKDEFLKAFDKLAEITGTAKKGKAIHARGVVRGVTVGALVPDDAAEIFERYTKAEGKKSAGSYSKASLSANKSKLKSLMRFASEVPVVLDPLGVLDKIDDTLKRLDTSEVKVKAAFQAYVDVAVAQLKSPDTALDDAQIEQLCKPSEKEETLIGELTKSYNVNQKIADTFGVDMGKVLESIAEQIVDAGGDVPLSKEEQEKQAEIKRAEARALKALEAVALLKAA